MNAWSFARADFAAVLLLLLASVFSAEAAEATNDAENAAIRKTWDAWNQPVKPFQIIGGIHYVGAAGVSSFLITTPEGHILIDTGFEKTVPLICESVARLGFRIADIKFLLSSHAHFDHTGGHQRMKELSGASIVISEEDGRLLDGGGTNDFTPYSFGMKQYPPVRADRIIRDGETVTLGGVKLVCHLTPGHTQGCTTWSCEALEDGVRHPVVFFGSTSILPGVPLVDNSKYPQIAEDFRKSYKTLKSMPCDVFLAPHGGFFGLMEKLERKQNGEKANPFIDPAGFRAFVERAEENFLAELEKQKQK